MSIDYRKGKNLKIKEVLWVHIPFPSMNHPSRSPSRSTAGLQIRGIPNLVLDVHSCDITRITFPVVKYRVFKEHNNNLITDLRLLQPGRSQSWIWSYSFRKISTFWHLKMRRWNILWSVGKTYGQTDSREGLRFFKNQNHIPLE